MARSNAILLLLLISGLLSYTAAAGGTGAPPADAADLRAYEHASVAMADSVRGRVVDARTNEPLPGVNIAVVGTQQGTATGANGEYELAVPVEGDSLIFSFIGYRRAQVAIAGRSRIDVALQPQTYVGEELVVIGYGTQQRADLTGAVSSLNAEDLERGPVSTVGELLQSKVAGLRAVSSGGTPGEGLQISIRGAGSISAGTGPLTVVDGQPSNVPVNPGDIESVEVLKGPSATAIYGARGANGVILITTKDGRPGDLRINYNGEMAMQSPSNRLDVLSAQQYAEVMNALVDAGAAGPEERVEDVANGGAGTDWQDVVLRNGAVQNHDLSFSGGTESTQYYASLGAFLENGIVESSSFERYMARMNLTHEVSSELSLDVRLNGLYRQDDYVRNTYAINYIGGALYSAFSFDPTLAVRNADGTFTEPEYISIDNPAAILEGRDRVANVYRFYGTAFAEYFFLPSLSGKVRVGADLFSRRQDDYSSRLTFFGRSAGGIANIDEQQDQDVLVEGTVTYDETFGAHDVNVLGGVTAQSFVNRSVSAHGEGFPSDVTGTNNLALGNPEFTTTGSSKSSNQLLSFIGRVNYGLLDRYRLTATIRADGSSRFGRNERFGIFPSAAAAWNIGRESFLADADVLSRLKARVSWGRTGNQAIGDYAALSTFGTGPTVIWGGQQVSSLNPSRLANPNLKWETTEQINVGLDFGLWNERLSGSLDYFWKDTYDMLLQLPIPSSTGFETQLTNIGSVSNHGFELSLSSNNVVTSDFLWSTDANFATLNNEVESLGPLEEIVTGSAGFTNQIAIIKPGLPLRSYYGYEVEGVWQEGDNFAEYGAEPGDFRLQDTNGDGSITPADRVPLGDSFPDITWGMGNSVSYKNWGLYVFVRGEHGMSMLNNNLVLTYVPTSFRRNRFAEPLMNRWTPENPSDTYPSFVNLQNEVALSSRTVQDASYVRLQTVRLNYKVPFETSLFRSLTVYAQGDNLYTITDYDGIDPAANSNNNANFRIDYNTYPSTRTYTLGVRLGL